jgi:hypothetical protein
LYFTQAAFDFENDAKGRDDWAVLHAGPILLCMTFSLAGFEKSNLDGHHLLFQSCTQC